MPLGENVGLSQATLC